MTAPVVDQQDGRQKTRRLIVVLVVFLLVLAAIIWTIVVRQKELAPAGPSGTLIATISIIGEDQSFGLYVKTIDKYGYEKFSMVSSVNSGGYYLAIVDGYTEHVVLSVAMSGYSTDGIRCEVEWIPDDGHPKVEYVQTSYLGGDSPMPRCGWSRDNV